jgi:hypothetical protein
MVLVASMMKVGMMLIGGYGVAELLWIWAMVIQV